LSRNLTINVKDMQKDKDLSLVVNSPLITGKLSLFGSESPLMNKSALFRKSLNKNDLSFNDKSAYLGKYGFLKPMHINEINSNLNSAGLNHSHSQSFHTESTPDSQNSIIKEEHMKSPSKFSISKKNNKIIQLNFAEQEQQCKTEELSDEEKKEEELKHKRNYSVACAGGGVGSSSFKKHEESKKKEENDVNEEDHVKEENYLKDLKEENHLKQENNSNQLIPVTEKNE